MEEGCKMKDNMHRYDVIEGYPLESVEIEKEKIEIFESDVAPQT